MLQEALRMGKFLNTTILQRVFRVFAYQLQLVLHSIYYLYALRPVDIVLESQHPND